MSLVQQEEFVGRLGNGLPPAPQVLSLFFTLKEGARDLGHLHELFRQVMIRLVAKDKKVSFASLRFARVVAFCI